MDIQQLSKVELQTYCGDVDAFDHCTGAYWDIINKPVRVQSSQRYENEPWKRLMFSQFEKKYLSFLQFRKAIESAKLSRDRRVFHRELFFATVLIDGVYVGSPLELWNMRYNPNLTPRGDRNAGTKLFDIEFL